jgi:hypothetical protein
MVIEGRTCGEVWEREGKVRKLWTTEYKRDFKATTRSYARTTLGRRRTYLKLRKSDV